MHNEELHNLYSSSDIIRQIMSRGIRCAGHEARIGKRPLGRPRRRWYYGIRMDLGEIGWGCRVDPVGSGHRPIVVSNKYGDEPAGSGAT
jgi:hypothetical protein